MNKSILKEDCQDFINSKLNHEISNLIFKGSPFDAVSIQELANQIQSKNKCKSKLPTWFNLANIYYPPKLSIEQTSSEITADYKSKIISGKTIIDITGGFGVDCYYFAKNFDKVLHCELNTQLSSIVSYNYTVLDTLNIETYAGDGLKVLEGFEDVFDCIYIDPSRRNADKGKVFLLKDCLPNVPKNLDLLFSKSNTILIKNSPILDIRSVVNELKFVKEFHVLAVNNEVKELLVLLEKSYEGEIELKTINITKKDTQIYNSVLGCGDEIFYSEPKKYLYEPNPAIMKAGCFNSLANDFKVTKLNSNSHLFTNDHLIDFPGRKFAVKSFFKYEKKRLKKELRATKANITVRNFPKSVEQLRKETKLKDGGDVYLFFTKDISDTNIVIICEKA